jgi:hypothetical protein
LPGTKIAHHFRYLLLTQDTSAGYSGDVSIVEPANRPCKSSCDMRSTPCA